jgi:hypothetical protein
MIKRMRKPHFGEVFFERPGAAVMNISKVDGPSVSSAESTRAPLLGARLRNVTSIASTPHQPVDAVTHGQNWKAGRPEDRTRRSVHTPGLILAGSGFRNFPCHCKPEQVMQSPWPKLPLIRI